MASLRANWIEGLQKFYDSNPNLKGLEWYDCLMDDEVFTSMLHDILKMKAETPHKSGPRPTPDRAVAEELFAELLEKCQ